MSVSENSSQLGAELCFRRRIVRKRFGKNKTWPEKVDKQGCWFGTVLYIFQPQTCKKGASGYWEKHAFYTDLSRIRGDDVEIYKQNALSEHHVNSFKNFACKHNIKAVLWRGLKRTSVVLKYSIRKKRFENVSWVWRGLV